MRLSGWTLIFPSQKSHSDRLLDNFTALLKSNEKINFSEVNPCVWMFLALILEVGKYYE